jgi:YbbR domain-containing protein
MERKIIIAKLQELFLKNWKAQLASFLIASLFYLNLQNSKILTKNINVPIEYPRLENGLYYAQTPEKTFPIRVEGLREIVNYYSQFMKAVVDIDDLKLGDNEVSVKKIVGVPSGIKITKLKKTILFTVEGSTTKQVPLEVSFDGELSANFEKVSYLIRPNKITINGKQSDVERLNKIVLPPISIQDQNESFVKKVRIPDLPKGVYVSGGIREAIVSVTISSLAIKSGEQLISGIPLKCIGTNQYLEPELSEEQVSIKIFSRSPLKSSSVINGIDATVPCNHSYDPIKKKIIPTDQPVVTKVRISRSRDLKNIEILQIIPEKVTIGYRIKSEENNPDEEETEPTEIDPTTTPMPEPSDLLDK